MSLRIPIVCLLLMLAPSLAAAQRRAPATSQANVERELIANTREVSRASVARDRATLERLMDPKFVMIAANEKSYTRDELIAMWTAPPAAADTTETSTPSDFRVFVNGDTAVVESLIVDMITRKNAGTTQIFERRAFDVWRRTKRGWVWIASRETEPKSDKMN